MSLRTVPALVLAGLVLLTSGCGGLGGTNGKGFVTQEGTVTEIDPGQRGDPVMLSGTDLDGKTVSLDTYRGKPVVINVWGSWCSPCVAEAPTLAAVAGAATVPFLGIDIRDNIDSAKAYNRSYGIAYPSIFDPGSSTLLAFRDYPVQSPPTTFVLDDQGRVAAVIAGAVPSQQTLSEVISQVETEHG